LKNYDPLIVETANILKFPPRDIEAMSQVYDTISRFAGMTVNDIEHAIVEIPYYENNGRKRLNAYRNLPPKLSRKLKELIMSHGNLSRHFNPHSKKKNFLPFCRKFIEKREQPRDYLFDGVITFREFKFAIGDDLSYSVETTDYDENRRPTRKGG